MSGAAQRRTALVYHERFLWHDAGPAASVIPAGGMVEPGPHAESPERVRRINALIEVSGLGEHLGGCGRGRRRRRSSAGSTPPPTSSVCVS